MVTALRNAAAALLGALVLVMAYGIYNFPTAPIRYVDGQYVDKRGRSHSKETFDRLKVWERALIVTWVASAISAVSYRYGKRRGLPKT